MSNITSIAETSLIMSLLQTLPITLLLKCLNLNISRVDQLNYIIIQYIVEAHHWNLGNGKR